jgi:hypothetical protein
MNRVITLHQNDLPMTAEVLLNGECSILTITKIHVPSLSVDSNSAARTQFELQNGTKVDVGQITTVWMTNASSTSKSSANVKVSEHYKERILEAVYRSHAGRGRKGGFQSNK